MAMPSNNDRGLSGIQLEKTLKYDPLTGVFTRRITRGGSIAGNRADLERKDGYRQVKIDGMWVLAHRLAWLWMYGKWPPSDLDHINRDRGDNKISNLRAATPSQNGINIDLKCHNTSGKTGVCWIEEDGKPGRWLAYIVINRKMIKLGRHKLYDSAVAARIAAELKYFAEFSPHYRERLS